MSTSTLLSFPQRSHGEVVSTGTRAGAEVGVDVDTVEGTEAQVKTVCLLRCAYPPPPLPRYKHLAGG